MEKMIGEIKMEIVGKEFYCRYCSSYEECRKFHHRQGTWFKIAFSTDFSDKKIIMIVGEGEREHRFPFNTTNVGRHIRTGLSGCSEYERGHVTAGGWYYIKDIIIEIIIDKTEDFKEIELTNSEKILLSKILNQNKEKILKILIDSNVLSLDDDWGLWNDVKPLFYVYKRKKTFELPLGAQISEHENSWKATFKWGNITFETTKKGRYHWSQNMDYIDVNDKIFYGYSYGRKIVYYQINNYALLGFEEYNSKLYSSILLLPRDLPKNRLILLLMKQRLGDVLFLDTETINRYPSFVESLQAATLEEVEFIKLLQGKLEVSEKNIQIKGDRITIYGENGILELPKGEYIPFKIQTR